MVRTYSLMLIFILLSSGCASTQIKEVFVPQVKIETQFVKEYVPVPCPPPPNVVRPELIIFQLTPEDDTSPGKVVQAYKASVLQLQNYSAELENLLNAYRTQPLVGGTNEVK